MYIFFNRDIPIFSKVFFMLSLLLWRSKTCFTPIKTFNILRFFKNCMKFLSIFYSIFFCVPRQVLFTRHIWHNITSTIWMEKKRLTLACFAYWRYFAVMAGTGIAKTFIFGHNRFYILNPGFFITFKSRTVLDVGQLRSGYSVCVRERR